MENPGGKSIALFVSMLFVAVASHVGGSDVASYRDLFEVRQAVGLVGVIGATLGAWLGRSPRRNGGGTP